MNSSVINECFPRETDLKDKYFKVNDPMLQEDLDEVIIMSNTILSQSPQNSALSIQPPMSPSIISFINPINSFKETMTETKYFSLSSNDFFDDNDDEIKYEHM
ncbi:hypothetical protein GIB67_037890, partial [Kingdonia uniflora]